MIYNYDIPAELNSFFILRDIHATSDVSWCQVLGYLGNDVIILNKCSAQRITAIFRTKTKYLHLLNTQIDKSIQYYIVYRVCGLYLIHDSMIH